MSKKKSSKAEETLLNVGQKIKELRIKAGYSSYETFAHDHDLDRKQYWRLENGANITLRSLINILQLHNKSLKDFFSKGFDEL